MAARRNCQLPASAVLLFAVLTLLQACADPLPTAANLDDPPMSRVLGIPCVGNVEQQTVGCGLPPSIALGAAMGRDVTVGETLVLLESTNVSYDSGTHIFEFDVTVQNLMAEAIGSPDGVTPDPGGIQVFFHAPPLAKTGSGPVTVQNSDGEGVFTAAEQKYFTYPGILKQNQKSSPKRWRFIVPPTVKTFRFAMYVDTDVQYKLVINEVMANPAGTEIDREWFEIYNAGTLAVDLLGLVIADSVASGRAPYHVIARSIVVPSGGYAVIGWSEDTSLNGGAPVDYGYGSALLIANSIDAIKISRVVGGDTLTLDRVHWINGTTVSALSGISRELKNPALDNANVGGTNWAAASATTVYGDGGRGTPKAQNNAFQAGAPCAAERFGGCSMTR